MNGEYRTGIGFDVHAFAADKRRKLVLGGVFIEGGRGLEGHSDADVLIHAVIDALLGAAALGDIGQHFPDTDPQYKDISSIKLLIRTVDKIKEQKRRIINIDITVMAEKPKLAGYIEAMRKCLAEAITIDKERINIKATTTEQLGFVGREEGIAALAVATLFG